MSEFYHARERRSIRHKYAEMETEMRPMVEAGLRNEQITRSRVDQIEAWRNRSFSGRLKWLFLGK